MLRLGTRLRHGLVGLALAACAAAAQAPLDVRVALVIGNGAYTGAAALPNPTHDAKAMARTLRQLGFTVVEIRDGGRAQMLGAIGEVRRALQGRQGLGLLFYAGHGLQQDWHNFMVPVDARLTTAADIPAQTVDIELVIEAFKAAGNRMNILILDACRDNPFGAAASGKGLAPLDAPPGTLLAYATAPGNVAEDGDARSGNGLYTQYLLQEMRRPAKIEEMFKRVRLRVREESQGRQIPWESTSLEDDFAFNAGRPRPPQAASPGERELDFARQKADWDRIKGSRKPEDFYAYLQKYPNGYISEQATFALEQLAARRVLAQPERNGLAQDPRQPRFRVGDVYATRTLDTRTGKEIERNTQIVQRIADARVYLTGTIGDSVRTLDGGVVSGRSSEGVYSWDPPRLDLPGDAMAVGKHWTGRTIETFERTGKKVQREDDVRIVALEDVTVPAGTFRAYKFVLESRFAGGTRVRRTYWAQPGWGNFIKVEREIYRPNQPPVLETVEMVSRTMGKP